MTIQERGPRLGIEGHQNIKATRRYVNFGAHSNWEAERFRRLFLRWGINTLRCARNVEELTVDLQWFRASQRGCPCAVENHEANIQAFDQAYSDRYRELAGEARSWRR